MSPVRTFHLPLGTIKDTKVLSQQIIEGKIPGTKYIVAVVCKFVTGGRRGIDCGIVAAHSPVESSASNYGMNMAKSHSGTHNGLCTLNRERVTIQSADI
jgi:hypothetical protein